MQIFLYDFLILFILFFNANYFSYLLSTICGDKNIFKFFVISIDFDIKKAYGLKLHI